MSAMHVRDSDYCVRCGSLMEPVGLIGRSDLHARTCVDCEDDLGAPELPITRRRKRPASASSTPQGVPEPPRTDLSDLRPGLTGQCGPFLTSQQTPVFTSNSLSA
jgi:hypothetical protein